MGPAWRTAREERGDRGAAAVEFALVAMILLTLIIMIIQVSLWMWAYQVTSHAAREGARVAAVDPCDDATAESRAVARVGGAATGIGAVMTRDPASPSPAVVGGEVTVQVTATARVVAPGLLPALPQIVKSATSRIENVPAGGC